MHVLKQIFLLVQVNTKLHPFADNLHMILTANGYNYRCLDHQSIRGRSVLFTQCAQDNLMPYDLRICLETSYAICIIVHSIGVK